MTKQAITVLTKGYTDINSYNDLITRNAFIYQNIILKSKLVFDMIIFHEGNITQDHQQHIQSSIKHPLIFKDVTCSENSAAFNDKKNVINPTLCPPTELSSTFPLGYKHMCHFWAIDFFNYLDEYDYVIRIDEDCFVDRVDPKILEAIIEQEITFAVPLICDSLDHPHVIVGLDKLLQNFLKQNNLISPTPFEQVKSPNTNFMILNMNYFKNHKLIQSFLVEVDKSHGIYSNRWGDAPIWGILVSILSESDYYELSDIGYLHGSHNHYVNRNHN